MFVDCRKGAIGAQAACKVTIYLPTARHRPRKDFRPLRIINGCTPQKGKGAARLLHCLLTFHLCFLREKPRFAMGLFIFA